MCPIVPGCQVCYHPHREAIDVLIHNNESFGAIAAPYPTLSKQQVHRHAVLHLGLLRRPCSICKRPDLSLVDAMLAKTSPGGVAKALGVSPVALAFHAQRHLGNAAKPAPETEPLRLLGALVDNFDQLATCADENVDHVLKEYDVLIEQARTVISGNGELRVQTQAKAGHARWAHWTPQQQKDHLERMIAGKGRDPTERRRALELADKIGTKTAATQLGIPINTLYAWATKQRQGKLNA